MSLSIIPRASLSPPLSVPLLPTRSVVALRHYTPGISTLYLLQFPLNRISFTYVDGANVVDAVVEPCAGSARPFARDCTRLRRFEPTQRPALPLSRTTTPNRGSLYTFDGAHRG